MRLHCGALWCAVIRHDAMRRRSRTDNGEPVRRCLALGSGCVGEEAAAMTLRGCLRPSLSIAALDSGGHAVPAPVSDKTERSDGALAGGCALSSERARKERRARSTFDVGL